jgi:hypothetical protein
MTVAIIKLSPGTTPENFARERQESLPDGVGLQIFFEVDGEYYLIAGPRAGGRVTAVNGGKIENSAHTFYAQIAEELYEETFGYLRIESGKEGMVLVINNQDRYPITMLEDLTAFEKHEKYHYCYMTFTAVCQGLSRQQLEDIAAVLTPTARFWNEIGNYLHLQCQVAPCHECGDFKKFWQKGFNERDDLIKRWIADYKQINQSAPLLADPLEIFHKDSIEEALGTLHDIKSAAELGQVFHHIVGNYSERSGYHVFNARELMQAARSGSQEVKNSRGVVVANGVYYSEVVETLYPHIFQRQPSLQRSPLFSRLTLWPVKNEIASTESHLDQASVIVRLC